MKPPFLLALMALLFAGWCCSTGGKMDFGQPAAQFLQADLASQGKVFLGEKITVKGTVKKVDLGDPKAAWVYLEGGVRCSFGKFTAMAESCEIGETVFVDGILQRCEAGDALLAPAILRDPAAPFTPAAHKK